MAGEWIEHDGRGRPVPVGTKVEVVLENVPGMFVGPIEVICDGDGSAWDWRFWMTVGYDNDLIPRIIRYRVKRPRALDRLREIAENPTAPLPVRRPSREFA